MAEISAATARSRLARRCSIFLHHFISSHHCVVRLSRGPLDRFPARDQLKHQCVPKFFTCHRRLPPNDGLELLNDRLVPPNEGLGLLVVTRGVLLEPKDGRGVKDGDGCTTMGGDE